MKPRINIAEDEELRGFRVKLYPTYAQVLHLEYLGGALRGVWNQLVKYCKEADESVQNLAIREGLVPPRPVRPNYDGLTPEESEQAAADFDSARTTWYRDLRTKTKGREDCPSRWLSDLVDHFGGGRGAKKQDYQALKRFAAWHGHDIGAHLLQHLSKNYQRAFVKGRMPPRFKRYHDKMPIGLRSGECFLLGDFGARRGHLGWYQCAVKLDGMRIRGRLPGKKPEGRVLEGVSIVREGSHWWASVKVVCKKRILQRAIPGSVVGIDVGLDNIAALADAPNASVKLLPERGILVSNPRGEYTHRREHKNRQRSKVEQLHLAREEARMARRVRHIIYNEVIKPLAQVETILVEELSSKIGQMGSRKVSVMRLTYQLLKERYGDRVREVSAAFTSQDCSHCGIRSKETWSYLHGAMGECPSCGYFEHRDINAARNVAAKSAI